MTRYKTNSSAKKRFAIAYAQTDNARKAIDLTYPDNELTIKSKYQKGFRMLKNDDVIMDIQLQKQKMEVLSSKAVNRLEDIITDGKEHNALMASTYVYDQVHGKATAVTEVKSQHVTVVYDLSGGSGGELPEEIKKQLENIK